MDDQTDGAPLRLRYRDVARDPNARGLVGAAVVSDIGDYVGLAALLVLAFETSGNALGPAAVYAVKAGPALAVGTFGSRWLDVPPRKPALVTVACTTALLLATVALFPTLTVALVIAGLMGAVRAVNSSVTAAAVAESVTDAARQPTLGLLNVSHQTGQVVGFLTGGAAAVLLSAPQALSVNVVTALVAALILAATPLRSEIVGSSAAGRRPARLTDGIRVLWAHPVLRFVAIAAWVTMIASAVPESLATSTSRGGMVAIVLASNAAGGVIGMLVAGRLPNLVQPRVQIWWVLGTGLGFAATALVIAVGGPAILVAAGNAMVGVSAGWLVGGQAAVLQHAPVERMAQVNATMISALIVLEGLGAVAIATIAVTAGPAAAYLTVGVLLVVTALLLTPQLRRMPDDAASRPTPDPVTEDHSTEGPDDVGITILLDHLDDPDSAEAALVDAQERDVTS